VVLHRKIRDNLNVERARDWAMGKGNVWYYSLIIESRKTRFQCGTIPEHGETSRGKKTFTKPEGGGLEKGTAI